MPFYASPEQLMRDKSEYARKGISRGRSVVVVTYSDGVLFVAENPSTALHKISEIYDRIGFAAVGRYNEFENLRMAGVRLADIRGYSYDQTLGAIFTEQHKPFEVEICIAQLGDVPDQDELYRITYDGSVADEPGFVAMGGQVDAISGVLRERHRHDATLGDSLTLAIEALGSVGGEAGQRREIPADRLEVAVLDRARPGRAFRRITGAALTSLLGRGPGLTDPGQPTPSDEAVDELIDELESGQPEDAPRPPRKSSPRKARPRTPKPESPSE
jgi:proteasome alpha subunit